MSRREAKMFISCPGAFKSAVWRMSPAPLSPAPTSRSHYSRGGCRGDPGRHRTVVPLWGNLATCDQHRHDHRYFSDGVPDPAHAGNESSAIHLKLDETISTLEHADNSLLDLEEASTEHLEAIKQSYRDKACEARGETPRFRCHQCTGRISKLRGCRDTDMSGGPDELQGRPSRFQCNVQELLRQSHDVHDFAQDIVSHAFKFSVDAANATGRRRSGGGRSDPGRRQQ